MPDLSPGTRCVAHPARLAADRCPTCDRPRCGADADGPTCQVCGSPSDLPVTRPPDLRERLVRAALGAFAMALAGGLLASEYIGAPLFQYLTPAIIGVAVGTAATAAAGEPRGMQLLAVRRLAPVYAVVAMALGVRLDGTHEVYALDRQVLIPYLVSAVACWYWTSPPRRRVRAASPG